MPESIGGFNHTEYLMVFVAIIFGYVGAEYFVGWGNLLRKRANIKIYWLHLLWTIFSFMMFITNWYGIWPRTEYITYNITYYFFALLPILIFYFINVILFPNFKEKEKLDLKEYYTKNASWLFSLFALYFLFTIIAGYVYFNDPGNKLVQNSLRFLGVVLSLLAAKYKDKYILHICLLIFGFAGLIFFILSIPTKG